MIDCNYCGRRFYGQDDGLCPDCKSGRPNAYVLAGAERRGQSFSLVRAAVLLVIAAAIGSIMLAIMSRSF